jgi:hypothetical protein
MAMEYKPSHKLSVFNLWAALFGKKISVPLPTPATPLFCSRSIPKTWVYAQRGNDRRPTLIRMHKHPLWVNPRTGAYAIENWIPF